jgi:Domain of unknown function (DUF4189)
LTSISQVSVMAAAKPGGGAMIGKSILAIALLAVSVGCATPSRAAGALAVGMPEGDPSKGFRWSAYVNNSDASSLVMKDCRASRNPATGAACKLVGTFRDQCVAIAVSGDPDPAPVSAAGWAIAPDSATATSRALAQCEAMRKKGGKACVLDNNNQKPLCDGKAK